MSYFPVLSTSRDEVAGILRERNDEARAIAVENADDDTMRQFASKVGNAILEGGDYWEALSMVSEDFFQPAANYIVTFDYHGYRRQVENPRFSGHLLSGVELYRDGIPTGQFKHYKLDEINRAYYG